MRKMKLRAGELRTLLGVVCLIFLFVLLLWTRVYGTSNVACSVDANSVLTDSSDTVRKSVHAKNDGKVHGPQESLRPEHLQVSQGEDCEHFEDQPFVFRPELSTSPDLLQPVQSFGQYEERLPYVRNFANPEPWPEVETDQNLPGQVPTTVHYVWCKTQTFGFHHYLGVLSILRLLKPIKLYFHYKQLPQMDTLMYNTWFLELKQSVHNLVLKQLPASVAASCDVPGSQPIALSFLQQNGGVWVSSNVIVTHVPRDVSNQSMWATFAASPDGKTHDFLHGVVITTGQMDPNNFSRQLSSSSVIPKCTYPETYEVGRKESSDSLSCVYVSDNPAIYPKDIMVANSSFAELARWLYYGRRAPLFPKRVPGSIPRISHVVWFNRDETSPRELPFYQYLTILSALYVAGLHHVYVHGNREFSGPWWEKLKIDKENVTFVYMEPPEVIFQQPVSVIEHKSDVARFVILYKYGGVYHDMEAFWTQRVPDWLLEYPAVANSDWVQNGAWPDNVNDGVVLSRPRARWVRSVIENYRYLWDNQFVFNSILMTYRAYEQHPDQFFMYRHLQVMCYYQLCHPMWHEGAMRDVFDKRPTMPFDWRTETLNLHVNAPDPEKSFSSPEELKRGSDMFADLGRFILKMSKKEDLLA